MVVYIHSSSIFPIFDHDEVVSELVELLRGNC